MFESRFQTFDDVADPTRAAPRLALLRAELARLAVDGVVVPRADEHQNEYVATSSERLAWLTGFTGSAGVAVVLADEAAIFVDGRYTLQVREQVDTTVIIPHHSGDTPLEGWIEGHLGGNMRLGYDPWLMTDAMVERLERAVKSAGSTLVALDSNPVDAVWRDRPPAPQGQVSLHGQRFAGRGAIEKIEAMRAALGRADALVVSDPHAVAWLFNLRGADVSHTPLTLAFAVLPREGKPVLYVDSAKVSNSVRDAIEDLAQVEAPGRLLADLAWTAGEGKTVRFDAATAPARLVQEVRGKGGTAEVGADPVVLAKAAKNATELEGTRAAHIRDGAAMVRFLAWFAGVAPRGQLSEVEAAEALESFRRDSGVLKDVSFPSISAFGPNAAIPHYRVSRASNLPIGEGLFLLDSGGQYEDGTTDVTRTMVVGDPDREMRDRYTRVLKGHVAISRAVFPRGTSGAQLDSLARTPLWEVGLDFDHGTGHGVGSFLSVHEGPQRLAKTGTVPLVPGMILSNEPGYYKAGHWGIRIENLIVVEPRAIAGAERQMLGFETITLVPYERALIAPKLLDAGEIAWIDTYHARVHEVIAPLVDKATRRWLKRATRPLKARA